jgi:hypothetical protein
MANSCSVDQRNTMIDKNMNVPKIGENPNTPKVNNPESMKDIE